MHVVLDSEALEQIARARPSAPLTLALEAAAATSGRVLLPTTVLVEQGFDTARPAAAMANRLLRVAYDDELSRRRAGEAVRLRMRSPRETSVVDAHVAAAALAAVREYPGTATVVTSDPTDIASLLDACDEVAIRSAMSVQTL